MAHLWMIYLVNMVIFAQFSIVVLNYQMVISCNFTLNPIKSPLIPSKLHDKNITIYHEVLFTYAGFSRIPPKTKDLDPGYRIRHVTEQELMEASGHQRWLGNPQSKWRSRAGTFLRTSGNGGQSRKLPEV